MDRRPDARRAVRDADRRLHARQRVAELASASRYEEPDADAVGEQYFRRRRAPPRELYQGLCAARGTRFPFDGAGELLKRHSEERRVGEGWVSTCSIRWTPISSPKICKKN